MTMKTKHILLGLSLGLLGGFTACDVTDLNPKDSITDNSYWNTVSDLENYAKGVLHEPDRKRFKGRWK